MCNTISNSVEKITQRNNIDTINNTFCFEKSTSCKICNTPTGHDHHTSILVHVLKNYLASL